jgi:hypothetical protein
MKKDPRVDAYVAKAAPFARPILRKLRAAVHTACPGAEETIKWGMPFFTADGKILCYMAAFRAHAAFGFWRGAKTAAFGKSPAKAGEAMGQLGRITSLADLPAAATLRGWIRKSAKFNAETPGRRS